MTTESKNKLMMLLVGLLVVVVAFQSIVVLKLYQRGSTVESEPQAEVVRMDLQPKTGQAPAAKDQMWSPTVPIFPFSGPGNNPDAWDPFHELRNMQLQMDQMFNDSFGRFRQSPDFQSMWGGTTFAPSMDVEEQDECYVVRMDIPGTDKSNISVNIDDRKLTVSGRIDETIEEQGWHQLRKERRSGEFKRALILPGPVKADGMEVTYKDGVLMVIVPKSDNEEESRKIKVK